MEDQMATFSDRMEAALLKLAEKLSRPVPSATPVPVTLVKFDPHVPDADIEGLCKLTDMVISCKQIVGVDLILALTNALKGRAASCLTKVNHEDLTWPTIKDLLLSTFSKPMTMQDHFDGVIKFQLGKESAAQGGLRLWQLIEKIPDVKMPDNVITGFTISVLSQCNDAIRKELNSSIVHDKSQLFRVLRSISLKRKQDELEDSGTESKKPRLSVPFRGNCNFCGRIGHRASECRNKNQTVIKPAGTSMKQSQHGSSSSSITCYVCNEPGHVASACPNRREKVKQAEKTTNIKAVNVCSKTARGTLDIEGMSFPFVFDSGSECSLIRESQSQYVEGERSHELVTFRGTGRGNVCSHLQIKCQVSKQDIPTKITFHVVLDDCLSECILLGRDLLESGISVELNQENILFKAKAIKICENTTLVLDPDLTDTDLTGSDKLQLLEIFKKYSRHFTQNFPNTRITTGELKINLIDPNKTVQRRPYRLSPAEQQVVDSKIHDLLDANIIRESSSPFASPILLVKKKDGSDRMCVNYRELNSNTIPDNYPLPLINDQINKLHGAHYFSTIDMASGFHQLPVHEESIEKTSFVTPTGQYEFLTMPFGFRNAPHVFND
ncbi:uncharacterized protein LOC113506100 [Trichoplusia ni]|uniref:Uncharacterized protein LOC113506100 n=1 Tax=Trichoplusia ni TaxID=7111 RepID=A0A7E5WV95_TRINI|nr:uncharacterized protein LOC113506100 [Trichoplusia ni]